MSSEEIKTGRKYRILSDATTKTWDRISFWTDASDVEMEDGTTLQSTVSAMETKIEEGGGACTKLIVNTTTASFDGLTVTCAGQAETFTAPFSGGKATFNLHYCDTYTISVVSGGRTYTKTASVSDIGLILNVTLNEVYSTVNLSTSSAELANAQIVVKMGGTQVDTTAFVNSACSYKVYEAGNYSFVCTYDGDEYNYDVTVAMNQTYSGEIDTLKIVTWANGTWDEIGKMLDAHYAGKIDVADYWSVGDTRSVGVSAMAATGVGESHDAQTVEFVIIGMKHDTLATPINGITKSAITIHMKNELFNLGYMNSAYNAYTYGKYSSSARRTWINNIFEKALPQWLQTSLKPVTKKTCEAISSGYSELITSTERCFMVSNWEVFGTGYQEYCTAQDGDQYEYYKTQSNRIKQNQGYDYYWWTRSGYWYYPASYARFCVCRENGNQYYFYASTFLGLAIGLCL